MTDPAETRALIERIVVDDHGSTVPSMLLEVVGWIEAATDELVHWLFEHQPASIDDVTVSGLVARVSKAGRV